MIDPTPDALALREILCAFFFIAESEEVKACNKSPEIPDLCKIYETQVDTIDKSSTATHIRNTHSCMFEMLRYPIQARKRGDWKTTTLLTNGTRAAPSSCWYLSTLDIVIAIGYLVGSMPKRLGMITQDDDSPGGPMTWCAIDSYHMVRILEALKTIAISDRVKASSTYVKEIPELCDTYTRQLETIIHSNSNGRQTTSATLRKVHGQMVKDLDCHYMSRIDMGWTTDTVGRDIWHHMTLMIVEEILKLVGHWVPVAERAEHEKQKPASKEKTPAPQRGNTQAQGTSIHSQADRVSTSTSSGQTGSNQPRNAGNGPNKPVITSQVPSRKPLPENSRARVGILPSTDHKAARGLADQPARKAVATPPINPPSARVPNDQVPPSARIHTTAESQSGKLPGTTSISTKIRSKFRPRGTVPSTEQVPVGDKGVVAGVKSSVDDGASAEGSAKARWAARMMPGQRKNPKQKRTDIDTSKSG